MPRYLVVESTKTSPFVLESVWLQRAVMFLYCAAFITYFRDSTVVQFKVALGVSVAFLALAAFRPTDKYMRLSALVSSATLLFELWMK